MYSWQRRTTASYSARVKFERGSSASGESVSISRKTQVRRRPGKPPDQLVEPVARLRIGGFRVDARPDVGQGDRQNRLANMVEEEHPVVERERKVGNAPIVGRHVGKVLGVSHRIVGGKADRSAHETRQAFERHRAITLDELLEIAKRIGRAKPPRRAGLVSRSGSPHPGREPRTAEMARSPGS